MMDANNNNNNNNDESDESINEKMNLLEERKEAADRRSAEINRKRAKVKAAVKHQAKIMEQNMEHMNRLLETLKQEMESNDREIAQLEAEREILLNEKLARLDRRQKATELISADIERKRKQIEAEMRITSIELEQYREQFDRLNKDSENQGETIDLRLKAQLDEIKYKGEAMQLIWNQLNEKFEFVKREEEENDYAVKELEAQKRIVLNEKLIRLDQRQETAEMKCMEISNELKKVEAEMEHESETMEQYRELFNRLHNEREIQRLIKGKISPQLKEELVEVARQGEAIEHSLNRLNRAFEALKQDDEANDRELQEVEAEKQVIMKNLRDLKISEIFRDFLNDNPTTEL